ncbi:MAG: HEPN domain-containing protein [Elusimicrobiota bacterium]
MNKKRIKFEAEGILTLQEYNISIPTNITIIQFYNGKLKGIFKIKNHSQDISQLYGNMKRLKFNFCGDTPEGKKLKIENENIYNVEVIAKSGEFSPSEFEILNDDMTDQPYSNLFSRFAITNFKMSSNEITINLENYQVKFEKQEDYDDYKKLIKESKESYITSYANFDNCETEKSSPIGYLNETKNVIGRILTLSGLSSGSYQCWACGEVFDNSKEGDLIYARYISPKRKRTGFNNLILEPQLQRYITKTYSNYLEFYDDLDLPLVVEWYLESLASTTIESRYLKGYICLEILVGRYAKMNDREFVIKDENKFEIFAEKISEKASEILREMEFDENKNEITCKIPDKLTMKLINRYSVTKKLKDLLDDFGIGYKDLLSDLEKPDIGQISSIRNNIVHQGIPEKEYSHVLEIYNIMICLIQRILLSLLEYEEEYYLDWCDKKRMKPFIKNPK